MAESKIVLKNWANGESFDDFYNPGQKFNIVNEVAYTFGDYQVSPTEAHRRGFEVDPSFKVPFGCNDRIKLADYIQGSLGITRQKHPDLYFRVYKHLGQSLPIGDMNTIRPKSSDKSDY